MVWILDTLFHIFIFQDTISEKDGDGQHLRGPADWERFSRCSFCRVSTNSQDIVTCYLLPNATVQEKQKFVTSYLEVYCVELQTKVREDFTITEKTLKNVC